MVYQGKYCRIIRRALQKKFSFLPPLKYDYPKVMKHFYMPQKTNGTMYSLLSSHSGTELQRAGKHEGIYINATPQNFEEHIRGALQIIINKPAR